MQQKARNMPYQKTLIKPKSLLWGGDCLDLFVLNVSTFFCYYDFQSFCKRPPHSAHRSLKPNKNACAFWGSHPHHSNKKDLGKCQSLFYGASNGIGLEPYCIEFAELTIHNTELMEQVNSFLCA